MRWLRHRAPYILLVVVIAFTIGGINHQVKTNNYNAKYLKQLVANNNIEIIRIKNVEKKLILQAYKNCRSTQRSWDARRGIILNVTEQIEYPYTSNLALRAAEENVNHQRLAQKERLLKISDGRPRCIKPGNFKQLAPS